MNVCYIVNDIDLFTNYYRVYNVREGLYHKNINSYLVHDKKITDYRKCYVSDLVILCRIRFSDEILKLINNLKKNGIPVVYDIDDLIFDTKYLDLFGSVRDGVPGSYTDNKKAIELIRETILNCDAILCSTAPLKDLLMQFDKPVYVIPNVIGYNQLYFAEDALRLNSKFTSEKINIGYFSGTRTHNVDFLEVADILHIILQERDNIAVHLYGEIDYPMYLLCDTNQYHKHPSTPFNIMLNSMASMDINLAPLQLNNVFNDCKSEIKILEAAIVEVPTIASSTKVYSSLIENSVDGFLAKDGNDWYGYLNLLINSGSIRSEIGLRSKKKCISNFYVGNIIDSIIEIYETIIK